jgi:uncharacterized phage-associated protein
MHSPLAIANEFIKRAFDEGRKLTPMQLQKLVYLAHGWNLAVTGAPLIEGWFEAWDWGPVNRPLYEALRKFGADPVDRLLYWGEDLPLLGDLDDGQVAHEELIGRECEVVDRTWKIYGKYEAFQLSALTHERNTPWFNVYEKKRNREVSNNAIQEYFVRLADAPT